MFPTACADVLVILCSYQQTFGMMGQTIPPQHLKKQPKFQGDPGRLAILIQVSGSRWWRETNIMPWWFELPVMIWNIFEKFQRKRSDIVFAALSVYPSVWLSDGRCCSCVILGICFHCVSPFGLFHVWVLGASRLSSHVLLFSSRPRQFVPGVDHAEFSIVSGCFLFDLLRLVFFWSLFYCRIPSLCHTAVISQRCEARRIPDKSKPYGRHRRPGIPFAFLSSFCLSLSLFLSVSCSPSLSFFLTFFIRPIKHTLSLFPPLVCTQ